MVTHTPKIREQEEQDSVPNHYSGIPMPVLGPRRDENSSSDEDSSSDGRTYGHYYKWEYDLDEENEEKVGDIQDDNVNIKVRTPLSQFIQMLILTAQLALLTGLTFGSVGAQWGANTVHIVIFTLAIEPLWSTIVLPLLWMNTLFWDGADFIKHTRV
jgi:hypothetical protein